MIKSRRVSHVMALSIGMTTVIPLLVGLYMIRPGLFQPGAGEKAVPLIILITGIIVSLGAYLLFDLSKTVTRLQDDATRLAKGQLPQTRSAATISASRLPSSEVSGIAEALNLITEQLVFNIDELEGRAILLERANSELLRLHEKNNEYMSHASHELRAPLINMKHCAQMFLDGMFGTVTEIQQETVIIIRNNAERLISLVTDVLDVSKIDAGKLVLDKKPEHVFGILTAAIGMVNHWCESKGIRLNTSFPGINPVIYADADRMRQVFINLLSNAIKYTAPKGRIEIKVYDFISAEKRRQAGIDNDEPYIAIEVVDNGRGIAPDALGKIFDRFVNVDGKNVVPGMYSTGLGLSIVKEVVELHKGRILVVSKLDEGSVFTVVLPVYAVIPAGENGKSALS